MFSEIVLVRNFIKLDEVKEYGKGFELRNLYYFLQFYKTFPNILHSASAKSNILLSWTHYKILLQVPVTKIIDETSVKVMLS